MPRHGPFTATNVKPVICHFSLSSHICGETFEPKQLTDYWFIVLLLVSFNASNTQVDDSTHHHKYACVMLLATRWNKQHKPQPQHSLTTTDAVGWFCFAHYSLYDQKLWVVLTSMMNISAFFFSNVILYDLRSPSILLCTILRKNKFYSNRKKLWRAQLSHGKQKLVLLPNFSIWVFIIFTPFIWYKNFDFALYQMKNIPESSFLGTESFRTFSLILRAQVDM